MTATSRRALLLAAGAAALAAACDRARPAADPQVAATSPRPPGPPPPVRVGPVVTVLGDSITAGLGLPAAEALPAQLQAALDRRSTPAQVRGAGVSGDTSAGGLARLDFSVAEDTAVCVLALGGNDLLQGVAPERLQANLDAAISRLLERRVGIVLAGLRPPVAASGDYGREFAAVFSRLASTHRLSAFVPDLMEGVTAELRQPDGLHPNAEGVRLMADRLAPAVTLALSLLRPVSAPARPPA